MLARAKSLACNGYTDLPKSGPETSKDKMLKGLIEGRCTEIGEPTHEHVIEGSIQVNRSFTTGLIKAVDWDGRRLELAF